MLAKGVYAVRTLEKRKRHTIAKRSFITLHDALSMVGLRGQVEQIKANETSERNRKMTRGNETKLQMQQSEIHAEMKRPEIKVSEMKRGQRCRNQK